MKNVIVLYGGESCEHDVSVITALTCISALKRRNEYNVIPVYMKCGRFFVGKRLTEIETYKAFDAKKFKEVFFANRAMRYALRSKKSVEVYGALICNHGGAGENGALSGYLQIADIPFSSSGVLGSAITMDKVFTKYLLEKFNLPVVPYRVFKHGDAPEILSGLGLPIIIKPANLGSSVGISYVAKNEELISGLDFSMRFDEKALVEKALTDFHEYNCAAYKANGKVIVSEVERPVFASKFLDFYDKYTDNGAKRIIPADITEGLRTEIRNLTEEVYRLFELSGVVRVDFLFADGKLYINEINSVPGSLACYLFSEKEGGYTMYKALIEDAVVRHGEKRALVTSFATNVLKDFDANKMLKGAKK